MGFPDFAALGKAHGLETVAIRGNNWRDSLREYLYSPGPSLAVVALDPNQPFEPKLSSRKLPDGRMVSSPLEDMYPFLDRAEFAENMNPPGLHA